MMAVGRRRCAVWEGGALPGGSIAQSARLGLAMASLRGPFLILPAASWAYRALGRGPGSRACRAAGDSPPPVRDPARDWM